MVIFEKTHTIFFGNEQYAFDPCEYRHLKNLLACKFFDQIKAMMTLNNLIFLKQTHSNHGVVIESLGDVAITDPFTQEGDFLITNLEHVGIGVYTADCLPIIIYDNLHHVCAIVHAGRKGSLDGVALQALAQLKKKFKTEVDDVTIIFGPSAKQCCYSVDLIAKKELMHGYPFLYDRVLIQKENQLFFDLPLFNQLILEHVGIPKSSFNLAYNQCTIHNKEFCSYRRDNDNPLRQMTIVVLN